MAVRLTRTQPALRALGIDVDVYHFNEGHALLAAFERARAAGT